MTVSISHELLKKLSGAAAFARGMDYFKNGHVVELNHGAKRVTATVQGSDLYRVTLKFSGRGLEGGCDCPASEGVDFCKHCVAVGLQLMSENAAVNALEHGSDLDKIKAYLLKQPKDKLVEQLCELAEADKLLRQRYLLRSIASEQGIDFKALRKQITAAIPAGRQLFRYPQVRAYFARVDELADYLADLESSADADKLQELIEYAIVRIDKALETIDDSGGFRLDSLAQLGEIHCRLMARNSAKPAARARRLLELLVLDGDGLFPDIPAAYGDALGRDGSHEFWRELQKRWDNTPPPADRSARFSGGLCRLSNLLLTRAEVDGDVAAQLTIHIKLAVDGFDYFRLAEFCCEHAMYVEALTWLDRSLAGKMNRSAYQFNERALALRSEIYSAQGKHEQALANGWQFFEKMPLFENVERLLALAKKIDTGAVEAARAKALGWLRDEFDKHKKATRGGGRNWSLHANTLIEIYLQQGDLSAAWEIAAESGVPAELLQQLADTSWHSHPDRAVLAYRRLIEDEVVGGSNQGYRRAVDLLLHQRDYMKKNKVVGFDPLLDELRVKFKAKRNFIKLLVETF